MVSLRSANMPLLPWQAPDLIEPLYSSSPGMSRRPSAMAIAGMVLSQPAITTRASNMWPRATSSTESAMTSRLTSEVFMPSVPVVMPSLMATVLTSSGVPPAARMPSITLAASSRWFQLQGMVPIQQWATPTCGRFRSSSLKPMAFIMPRATARSGPSSRTRLLCRVSKEVSLMLVPVGGCAGRLRSPPALPAALPRE